MLKIKTRLDKSLIHGIGLFADQFIPKGTITWALDYEFDNFFTAEQISRMTLPARNQFFNYAYFDKSINRYILCFDDLRFINHCSRKPNISSSPDKDIAARDIEIGEELLCDYNQYEAGYFIRRGIDESTLI